VSFCIELFCVVTLQYQILVRIAIAYFIIEKKKAVPQPWQAIAQRFCSIEILRGTSESIEQAVIDCFRKCWDNPRGFTIAPGCDIPVQTSLENIDAYMSAARKCAKYPVQPSNWE